MSSHQTATNMMEYTKSMLNSEDTSKPNTYRNRDIADEEEIFMRELTPRILEAEPEDELESKKFKSDDGSGSGSQVCGVLQGD